MQVSIVIFVQLCYDQGMEFSKYLIKQYFKWQEAQGVPCTVTDFARWLGVKQQSMSAWMHGAYKPRKVEDIEKLSEKLGYGVYESLGLNPLPKELDEPIIELAKAVLQFPPEMREGVRGAIIETGLEAASKGKLDDAQWMMRRMVERLQDKFGKTETGDSSRLL